MARSVVRLVAVGLGAVLLTGCGDGDGSAAPGLSATPVDVATPAPPVATPTPAPTPVDEKPAVLDQLARYLAITDDLAGAGSIDKARMTTVMTDAFAAEVLPGFRQNRRDGLRHSGHGDVSGETVTIAGDRATVSACVDQSRKRLTTQDGRAVDNPFTPTSTTFTFVKAGGAWKVTDVKPRKGC